MPVRGVPVILTLVHPDDSTRTSGTSASRQPREDRIPLHGQPPHQNQDDRESLAAMGIGTGEK